MRHNPKRELVLPESCTNIWINLAGVAMALLAVVWIYVERPALPTRTAAVVLVLLAFALPVLLLELWLLKPYRNDSAGLCFDHPQYSVSRVLVKLLGFYCVIAVCTLFYWLFPEYRGGYYSNYFVVIKAVFWPWMLIAAGYFFWLDGVMREPRDGYWKLGMCLLGRPRRGFGPEVGQLFLGWLVKLFFLPLMFVYTGDNLVNILATDAAQLYSAVGARQSLDLYLLANNALFFVDLLIITVGYCLTVRVFDSHIRSTEPTLMGWFVAVLCYQPFWGAVFGALYISYSTERDWSNVFWSVPEVHFAWALLILSAVTVYVWASVAFGVRFSNLTHRGVLTGGPYRYTKHPAYVSKNLSWWLIFMPFIVAPEFEEKLRLSLLLLLQNLVYFLRARTEERHLSFDPVYCQYAAYIERYGLFRRLGVLWPSLKFQPGSLLCSKRADGSPNDDQSVL